MKLIFLKSALKCDSFDVGIGIKIPFLEFWLLLSRVAPLLSRATVRYHELFDCVWLCCLTYVIVSMSRVKASFKC